MSEPRIRRTQRMTIKPREAAALHRLLDAYLATTEDNDPGAGDLAAFFSRLSHAQMDHAAYESKDN